MASINNVVKYRAKGAFTTTDATATDVEIENNLAETLPQDFEEAVVRVSCKVTARNRHFAAIAYYFEVHALFEYNRFEHNQFSQVGTATSTTHSEPTPSVCTCTMNDDNDVISLQIAGEAGETFDWSYETEITAAVADEHLDWLTFQIFNGLSGVANLSEDIDIDGTTVSPTLRYYGGDATNTDWTAQVGETLTKTAGSPTLNDGSPCLGSDDDSVLPDGSTYYQAAGTSYGNIGTNDIFIEGIIKGGSATKYVLYKKDGADEGYYLYHNGSRLNLLIEDDATNQVIVTGANNSLMPGEWAYFALFVDRNEASVHGSNLIINGATIGSGLDCSAIGDADNTGTFTIGATASGGSGYEDNIAYLAIYKGTSLWPGGSQNTAIFENLAANRFAKVSGRYPQAFTHDSVIADGDMEAVGVGDWTVYNNATLSKETADPYEGTRNLKVLYNGTSHPAASQIILIAGHKYQITGKCRSGGVGSEYPRIQGGTGMVFTGTTSTSWQDVDVTFVAGGTTVYLYAYNATGAGEYCEFDDMSVTRVDELPIVATRAYSAYLDKVESGDRKLYLVGSEWLRQCHRNDGTWDIYGYLGEQQSKNEVPYSEEIDNAAWAKTQCTISADAIAAPNKNTVADGMISSSVAGTHAIADAVTSSAGTDTVSCWAKKGAEDWLFLHYGLGAAASCYFDLDNGVVGTESNCTGYIEDWGNGWYRCIMVLTGDGASHTFTLFSAEADTDISFTGDDITVSTYVWGIQYEQGMDYASSYIPTSGGTATRLKDQLQHKADDGNVTDNQQGTLVSDIMFADYDVDVGSKYIVTISDGGASADRVAMLVSTTSDVVGGISLKTAGNTGSSYASGDVADGNIHAVRTRYEDDYLVAYNDGVPDASPDTSCDMPSDLDRIDIGMSQSATNHFNGLIQNLRIYNTPTSRG